MKLQARKHFIVTSDTDRTFLSGIGTRIAIKHNSSLTRNGKWKSTLALLDEGVVRDYCKMKGKKKLETPEDAILCYCWGYYDTGRGSEKDILKMKALFLEGFTRNDLDAALQSIEEWLSPGALEYAKKLDRQGFHHLIASNGWAPFVEGIKRFLHGHGIDVHVFGAVTPKFDKAGTFAGQTDKINKWDGIYRIYSQLGFAKNGNGIYVNAAAVDDSMANISHLKEHGFSVAFNAAEKNKPRFEQEGVWVEKTGSLDSVADKIVEYARGTGAI